MVPWPASITMNPTVSSARIVRLSSATPLPVNSEPEVGGVCREPPRAQKYDQSASFSVITCPITTGLV